MSNSGLCSMMCLVYLQPSVKYLIINSIMNVKALNWVQARCFIQQVSQVKSLVSNTCKDNYNLKVRNNLVNS